MNKAILLIGLILLLGGGGTLWWVVDEMRTSQKQVEVRKLDNGSGTQDFMSRYDQWLQLPEEQRVQAVLWADANGQPKTESQIHAEQQERLMADIDKLALGISGVESYTDVLYGNNWRQAVDDYKQQQERKDFIFNCSVVCTSLGGVITVLMILIMLAGLVFKGSKEKNVEISTESVPTGKRIGTDDTVYKHGAFRAIGKNNKDEDYSGIMRHPADNAGNKLLHSPANAETAMGQTTENQTDAKQEVAITSQTILAESRKEHSARRRIRTGLSGSGQTGNIPQARQDDITAAMSESELVQNANGQEKGKTANHTLHTLMELTQQVSAIREYAANQQNRLKRFQDGYDWNIIKNFCLRIIRCIDNIESRIDDMAAQDADTSELEQIRDELVFALESSGVERFEPELNSEYRGQEKFAEALKDKCGSGDSDMKGRIEKVIRSGYQCYIDENNIRVVRPAQVRLYA